MSHELNLYISSGTESYQKWKDMHYDKIVGVELLRRPIEGIGGIFLCGSRLFKALLAAFLSSRPS
jgi:hypothetical protein